jgi:hypothetical protein
MKQHFFYSKGFAASVSEYRNRVTAEPCFAVSLYCTSTGWKPFSFTTESAYEANVGWRLCFQPQGIKAEQDYMNGDYTDTYRKVTSPTILMLGARSPYLIERSMGRNEAAAAKNRNQAIR